MIPPQPVKLKPPVPPLQVHGVIIRDVFNEMNWSERLTCYAIGWKEPSGSKQIRLNQFKRPPASELVRQGMCVLADLNEVTNFPSWREQMVAGCLMELASTEVEIFIPAEGSPSVNVYEKQITDRLTVIGIDYWIEP